MDVFILNNMEIAKTPWAPRNKVEDTPKTVSSPPVVGVSVIENRKRMTWPAA